ncbi:MAG: hypothetical protein S4CHLAM81_10220 [Chlamydiales bacterium]|nr:hypothetical protein [Chlamydiales bacterium]MCH9635800.1 hypothetical protein [Chlamydiales bacterium]
MEIQETAKRIAIASAATLVGALALQIGALYMRNIQAASALTTLGKVGSFVGGAGLGIALPIYVMKRGANDPHIYKKVLIAAVIGVIAGALLLGGLDRAHPAMKMVGQSLITTSGGLLLTVLFYYMLYGQNSSSSAVRQTGRGDGVATHHARPAKSTAAPRATLTAKEKERRRALQAAAADRRAEVAANVQGDL